MEWYIFPVWVGESIFSVFGLHRLYMISLVVANYRCSNSHLLPLHVFYHDWHHHLIITAVDKESEFLAPKSNLGDLLCFLSLDQSECSLFMSPSFHLKAEIIWRLIYLCLGFFPTLCSKRANKCKHLVPHEILVFENLCLSGIGPNMIILICFPFCGLKSCNKCWLGNGGLRHICSPKVNWLHYASWTEKEHFDLNSVWLVSVSPKSFWIVMPTHWVSLNCLGSGESQGVLC